MVPLQLTILLGPLLYAVILLTIPAALGRDVLQTVLGGAAQAVIAAVLQVTAAPHLTPAVILPDVLVMEGAPLPVPAILLELLLDVSRVNALRALMEIVLLFLPVLMP